MSNDSMFLQELVAFNDHLKEKQFPVDKEARQAFVDREWEEWCKSTGYPFKRTEKPTGEFYSVPATTLPGTSPKRTSEA